MTRKFSDLHPNEQDRSLVVELTPSTFGGGWARGMNAPSTEYLLDFFGGEDPAPTPFDDVESHIVEPYVWADLIAALEADGAIVL